MADTKDKNMYQRLQLEVLSKDAKKGTVTFKIVAQSNRGDKFGNEIYDKGIGEWLHHFTYRSQKLPAWDDIDCVLYVRGTQVEYDEKAVTVNNSTWAKIKTDVELFNERFRGSPRAVIDNIEDPA